MSFYAGLSRTASKMLGDKGRAMVLRKRTAGAYDPATGVAAITTEDHNVIGAEFDFPALLIDGTTIQRGDKKIILAADGMTVEPDVDDVVLVATVPRNVVSVKAINPAGTVVVYILQVRK